ncbi:hypothetical protein AALP_AA3G147600 [Arabis alpina]|uniref:Uncharacterized protein n=1 Tax=Arabis alpina TaxID=50452 RepID=A0A087H988_ARAAL|nr:hypothetical protein AALP_AA3G147600 [Arabis alpina]
MSRFEKFFQIGEGMVKVGKKAVDLMIYHREQEAKEVKKTQPLIIEKKPTSVSVFSNENLLKKYVQYPSMETGFRNKKKINYDEFLEVAEESKRFLHQIVFGENLEEEE